MQRRQRISMPALQWLLALAVQTPAGRLVVLPGCPRRELLRRREAITAALRRLGPGRLAQYERMLSVVRSQARPTRLGAKVRQERPRRTDHKPPKPPKLRMMSDALKAKRDNMLNAA